ncbi:MAG: oligopeptide transport system substrate-binding protein [Planctomycetota bacterium]|jgi:oligopeptide transport system substrate-binding protein
MKLKAFRSNAITVALAAALSTFLFVNCGGDEVPADDSGGATETPDSGGATESTDATSDEGVGDTSAGSTADANIPVQGGLKIARVPMTTDGPKSLDPMLGSTMYDNRCCSLVYQTLLQYSYLKRPLELEPLLAKDMPTISADGLTWTFHLREDVYFHDDACFEGGKGRKLVASDVEYSWKRMVDPANSYKNWWLLENLIVGFDAYKDAQAALVDGGAEFDYSAPVEGIKVVDDHTLVLTLKEVNQQFSWKIAMFQLAVVPREAVERYGDNFSGHPVGSGPFMMEDEADWRRGTSLRLVKNPNYMEETFPEAWDDFDLNAGMDRYTGQRLPMIDGIEITFFVESQAQWLEFRANNMDFSTVPEFGFAEAYKLSDKSLKSSWAARGISSFELPLLDFIFRAFNMEDELVGGYEAKNRALRQAICLALDLDEMNEAHYNGENIVYDGPIPPGLDGFPEGGTAPVSYRGPRLAESRAKLVEAGYTIGEDGKVTDLPVIEYYTSRGATSEKMTELTMRNLEKVGIKLNPHYVDFSELITAVNNKKATMFSFAWGSDYPDAENNLAMFYSPNVSPGSNHFNYSRPEFDKMYEQIRGMAPGPERTEIYETMRDMLIEDAPYAGSLARTRRYLIYPWLRNYKPSETFYNFMKYWDIDVNDSERPE